MGRALTLCAFQIGVRKDLPEWGKGADIDMGLLQARGCKLSRQKHHLLVCCLKPALRYWVCTGLV